MEAGCVVNSGSAKVVTLSPVRVALLLLGERKAQRNCRLLDHGCSATAAQCSTSGNSQAVPVACWSSSYYRQRPREKFNPARGHSKYLADQVSVMGSVEAEKKVQEVIELPAPSQDLGDDPTEGDVQKESLVVATGHLNSANNDEASGTRFEDDAVGLKRGEEDGSVEAVEKQDAKETRQGWRELGSVESVRKQGNSKAYRLLKRPRYSSKIGKPREPGGADHLAAPSLREEVKLLSINQDPVLQGLFKSITLRDRRSAVERYFGLEVEERITASEKKNQASREKVAAEYSFSSKAVVEKDERLTSEAAVEKEQSRGKASDPVNLKVGGRLKINLDLDLYRARCLVDKERWKEAEAILRECIRDWPDDGRSYLALGLLSSPRSSWQMKAANGDLSKDLNGSIAAGIANDRTLAWDNLISGNTAESEGADNSEATVPKNPAVSEGEERLKINLDLQLYQAKCFRRRGQLEESEAILRKCIRDWPDDGRPYVTLGKQLSKQNRIPEARTVYDNGCQAVRGENPYIWQAWGVLEEKCGDVAKARNLFDAAVVADKKHVAAWHGWAVLELRSGNVKRARALLNKGLKFCGSNEYIFQTLALLEFREGKVEQARTLLSRAVQHSPKSAPSWLAWALMESQNNLSETARRLFQKGVQASPKNRYVWQAWALFEARQGKQERARQLFQAGHELNLKDAILLQAFALFEFECGRPGVARDLFRRAFTCDPCHQPVLIAWGWMEWKQQNLSVARELYQGAIQIDSRSLNAARAFQAWGVLEDSDGHSGTARELFKCALKIDSQSVPTWMAWAAMEERQGRAVRADEIRNLFQQQRTEVVDGVSWDVDFSDLLAPAIDRIKGFFKVDQQPAWSRKSSRIDSDLSTGEFEIDELGPSIEVSSEAEEFDVGSFLREKFPWKYGSRDRL